MNDTFGMILRASLILAAAGLLVVPGCGPDRPATFPVRGTVVYADGTPVTGGMVEFEPAQDGTSLSESYNARGRIDEEGRYVLTTFSEADGAVPGRHRVIVQEPYPSADLEAGPIVWKPSIDPRYRRYDASGLEFEVEQGENEIEIVVTHPGPS